MIAKSYPCQRHVPDTFNMEVPPPPPGKQARKKTKKEKKMEKNRQHNKTLNWQEGGGGGAGTICTSSSCTLAHSSTRSSIDIAADDVRGLMTTGHGARNIYSQTGLSIWGRVKSMDATSYLMNIHDIQSLPFAILIRWIPDTSGIVLSKVYWPWPRHWQHGITYTTYILNIMYGTPFSNM